MNGPTGTAASGDSKQSTVRINLKRYKTELCRHMLEKGACPVGELCAFAHDATELRTVEMNLEPKPPLPQKRCPDRSVANPPMPKHDALPETAVTCDASRTMNDPTGTAPAGGRRAVRVRPRCDRVADG